MDLLSIAMELLSFVPQAIKVGIDMTSSIERALALYSSSAPATPEQLAELAADIAVEKATLARLTGQLNTDPT